MKGTRTKGTKGTTTKGREHEGMGGSRQEKGGNDKKGEPVKVTSSTLDRSIFSINRERISLFPCAAAK
tara:strand:- start:698 stop:901 length:204 start_codon:yes stop_codon:yes gene_type:complete